MANNRKIILKSLPQGALQKDDFECVASPLPSPAQGEVLIKTLYLSIDAANRSWMQGETYRAAVKAGDVMPSFLLGRVAQSNDASVPAGALVEVTDGEWADYLVRPTEMIEIVRETNPPSHRLSVLGVAGKTAYFGLLHVGELKEGETLVVSAAAGSVGTLVGQIGKIKGCRVVGVAGGANKCKWLVEELGFDAAVDYKAGNVYKDLKRACPDGIDVYFDNVGGEILQKTLFQMNLKGRIVCCGAISQYDTNTPSGPSFPSGLLVVKRIRMEGFIALDYPEHEEQAEKDLSQWVSQGLLVMPEDIVDGLEKAPDALIGLLNGDNRGKRMVRVS